MHALDLQPGAMKYIIRLLKRNSKIKKLNLFCNSWGDKGLSVLLDYLKTLKKHDLNLMELNLGWSMIETGRFSNQELQMEMHRICQKLGIKLILS